MRARRRSPAAASLLALPLALAASCSLGTSGLGTSSSSSSSSAASSGGGGEGGAILPSAAVTTTASSSSSAASSGGGGGDGGTIPTGVWSSYRVKTENGANEMVVYDAIAKVAAKVIPYQSKSLSDLGTDVALTSYTNGPHPDAYNNVDQFWGPKMVNPIYPYAGKSTVGRGLDSGEQGTPDPLGVFDLQLFPPDQDKLVVAAFVVPFAGDYEVSNLGARRVSSTGDKAYYHVFVGNMEVVPQPLLATNDQHWVTDPQAYPLGMLVKGARINFAVDRNTGNDHDATEIIWTITAR